MISWIQAQSPNVPVEINSHAGPPADTDLSYADVEAQLAVASHVGFGMENLSIGDPYELAQGKPCGEDWCKNFATYADAGLPLVLQTTIPTLQPEFTIGTISTDGHTATATCTGPCDFYRNAWVQITGNSTAELNGTFIVTDATATSFSFASSSASGSGGTAIGPDYLPTTVPFAVSERATALEFDMCDMFYAFDPNPVVGMTCSTPPGSDSAKYAAALTAADGK
jgi:hypothetical protein